MRNVKQSVRKCGTLPQNPQQQELQIREYLADCYDREIKRRYSDKIAQPTGSAGTVVAFMNNTVHWGGFPEPGYVHYACIFHFYPSDCARDFMRYRDRGPLKNVSSPKDSAVVF